MQDFQAEREEEEMNLGMREMPEDTERKSWYKMEKRQKNHQAKQWDRLKL